MTRYLLSKLGQAIVTIVLVVLVVFALLRFMPTAGYFSKEQYKEMSDAEKTHICAIWACLTPFLLSFITLFPAFSKAISAAA